MDILPHAAVNGGTSKIPDNMSFKENVAYNVLGKSPSQSPRYSLAARVSRMYDELLRK